MDIVVACCGEPRRVRRKHKLLADDAWRKYCQYQILHISFCPKCKSDVLYWQAQTDLVTPGGHHHKLGAVMRIPQYDHAKWIKRTVTDAIKLTPEPVVSEYSRRVAKPCDLQVGK